MSSNNSRNMSSNNSRNEQSHAQHGSSHRPESPYPTPSQLLHQVGSWQHPCSPNNAPTYPQRINPMNIHPSGTGTTNHATSNARLPASYTQLDRPWGRQEPDCAEEARPMEDPYQRWQAESMRDAPYQNIVGAPLDQNHPPRHSSSHFRVGNSLIAEYGSAEPRGRSRTAKKSKPNHKSMKDKKHNT